MIEYIRLQGFMKHENTKIKFSDGITTLWGLNSAGKTTILRALWWICFNEPRGIKLINWSKNSARVTLGIDGHKVVRFRSKTKNYYKLDGKLFKAPKTGVPDAIAKILNVGSINFQNQDDGLFLISQSAPQVGRELNSVIDLDIIDSFLANVASGVREAQIEEKLVSKRLEEALENKKRLGWVKGLDSRLCGVEKTAEKLEKTATECDLLDSLLESLRNHKQTAQEAKEIRERIESLVTGGTELVRMTTEIDELQSLIVERDRYKKLVGTKIPDLSELELLCEKLVTVTELCEELEWMTASMVALEEEICETKRELEQAHTGLRKESRGKCPLCKQSLKGVKL